MEINRSQPTDTLLDMDLHVQIAKHVGLKGSEKGSNFLLSPLSIHTALSMMAVGSRGRTLEQILSFLKSESTHVLNSVASQLMHLISADGAQNGGPSLAFINGVWVEKSFPMKASFRMTLNTIYKAEAKGVDFQTEAKEVTEEVNLWAENTTNGLIKVLLPSGSLDSSSVLVLVLANALYFKGAWNKKFDPTQTQNREFYLLNGSTVDVPFMTSHKKQYLRSFDGFKVLKLPYHQGQDQRQFSMYFFLPNEKDGLPSLIQRLSSDSKFLDRHVHTGEAKVGEFWLPKFKISLRLKASEVMKEIGLLLPFSNAAEFTEMVESEENPGLYVSEIFHQCIVEVNEEGTEAAAATAVLIRKCCAVHYQTIDFVADHPFMFMIREDVEGVVLFVGSVINPSITT